MSSYVVLDLALFSYLLGAHHVVLSWTSYDVALFSDLLERRQCCPLSTSLALGFVRHHEFDLVRLVCVACSPIPLLLDLHAWLPRANCLPRVRPSTESTASKMQ